MNRNTGIIFCLSYGLGLLLTGFFGFPNPRPSAGQWLIVLTSILLIFGVMGTIAQRALYPHPRRKVWLIGAVIAFLGAIYLQWRIPTPGVNDISRFEINPSASQYVTLEGKVLSETRLTRTEKLQLWLEVREILAGDRSQPVTGKLYVTLPRSETNKLYPGQLITVKGSLSGPKTPTNPGSFDFKSYLTARGCFATLRGKEIIKKSSPPPGLWQLRQRIVNAQKEGLKEQFGSLVSSITLGRQAVDLSPEIQDLFTRTGLTHVLAVSGFHIALLLGVILKLTRNLSPRQQFFIGITTMIFYIGLTGIQPSIMRASLMGVAGLIGLVYNRQVNAYGSLIVVATLLLLCNPLWIFDLGFDLSFLATLGLIAGAGPIQKRLDYLPSIITEPIGITLAASLWTLPLLLYSFSSFAVYSIPVNIITTPLTTVISLGGVLSGALALIYPPLGSFAAWLLYYPLQLLINILSWFANLPITFYAVGQLSLGVMILIYGSLWLVCWLKPLQKRWYLVGLFIISLICIPTIYNRLSLVQVTVFDSRHPTVVIQERGEVIVINGNEPNTFKYSLLPFLQQQGINRIDVAIVKDNDVSTIEKTLKIYRTIDPRESQQVSLGSIAIDVFDNGLLRWEINNLSWLFIHDKKAKDNLSSSGAEVILWAGKSLPPYWLERANPKVAIAISKFLTHKTHQSLVDASIDVHITGRDGAIMWTPDKGFEKFLEKEFEW
ncbi:MAG: hypothetical protein N5P05_003395 [Chroococcopsis gigantea SAG 12.99]|jgi:competence protein ComEC|nr:ComEC/Rec2 family competence protein [Chlorogloea purpurea SAG 13.99]MDV3001789.1 hypothetical protein [Chroococcopsis gigantea SAG 12.99]